MSTYKYLVNGDQWVRVRQAASKDSDILGGAKTGSTVEIVDIANNWARVLLAAGGVELGTEGAIDTPAYGWMYAPLLAAINTTPVVGTAICKIGFSCIYNRDAAFAVMATGCRYISIVGNPALAGQIKDAYPDAIVVVRPYLNQVGSLPSVSYVMNQLNGATDGRLEYTGINESDQVGQDIKGLQTRAPFDVAMAKAVKAASGARYAAGSFSVGCPDATSQALCELMKTLYAPHFNSGLFDVDHHLYSPNMRHIYETTVTPVTFNGQTDQIAEQQWYETRHLFDFQRFGFDPNSESDIYCTETGVDEGSVGGFPAHNVNGAQVVAWAKRFVEITSAPFTIAGQSYANKLKGAAIFQVGDTQQWLGYNVQGYAADLGNGGVY